MTKTKLATLTTIPLFVLGSSAIAGFTFGTIVNTINHDAEQTNGKESLNEVIRVTNFVPSNGNCNFTGIPDEKSILALVKQKNPNLKVNGVKVAYDPSTYVNRADIVPADNVSIYSGSVQVKFKVNEDKPTLNSIYGGNTMTIVPNTEWFVGTTPSTIDAIDVLKYFCLKYHGNLPSGVHLQPNQITISDSDINLGSSSTIEINAKQFSQIYTPSSTPLTLNFDFVLPAVQTPFSDLQLTATLPTEFKETPNDYELISAIQNANSGSTDPVTQAFCAYDFSQTSIDDLNTYFTIVYPLPGSGVEFSVTLHESFIIDNGSARYEILASDTPITVTGSIAVKYDLRNVCTTSISSDIYDGNPDESDITLAVYNLSSALQDITTEAIFEANVDVTDINVDTKTAVISATSSSLLFQGTVGVNWGTQGTNGYSIDGTDWPGYVSGQISITTSSSIQNGVNGTATITSSLSQSYVAHNMIIPDTVRDAKGDLYDITEIGNHAFYNNSGLTGSLHLPSKLISVGSNAFYANQGNLTGNLIIPDSVTSIGSSAFTGTKSHHFTGNLIIPSSVEVIGSSAFRRPTLVTSRLYFLSSANSIELKHECFAFTSLDSIYIDRALNIGGSGVFSSTNVKNIFGIGEINFNSYSSVFSDSDKLQSVDLTNFTSIPDATFANCKELKKIIIPSFVSSLGRGAFAGCSELEEVTFEYISSLSFGTIGFATNIAGLSGPCFARTNLKTIIFNGYSGDSVSFDGWTYEETGYGSAPFGVVNEDLPETLLQYNNFPNGGQIIAPDSTSQGKQDILAQLKEWNLPEGWTVA